MQLGVSWTWNAGPAGFPGAKFNLDLKDWVCFQQAKVKGDVSGKELLGTKVHRLGNACNWC